MAVVTKTIGTGVGSAGTGNVDTVGTTAVTSGSVATAFTSELTAPGTIEIAGTLYNIASITDDDNLVTVETVSSGTNQSYNIGLRHYSTITLWEADLDDSSTYSALDDAVGECYNDSAFDEALTINGGGGIGLTSIKLTVPVAERHDGTADNGSRIVYTSNGSIILDSSVDVTFEWLEIDGNGNAAIGIDIETNQDNGIVSNIILHDKASTSTQIGIRVEGSGVTQAVLNCIIYNMEDTGTGTEVVNGIARSNAAATITISNNTVHNMINTGGSGLTTGIQLIDRSNHAYQNNIMTDPDTGDSSGTQVCYDDQTQGPATFNHNLASDDTDSGTGSIGADDGVLTANQYVQTMSGSEDLHLKVGADAIDAGTDLATTPTGINIDIDGFDRHNDTSRDPWDMGAHEFEAVGEVLVADAGSFVVTGTAASMGITMPVDSGSFVVTGTAVSTVRGRTLVADSGSFVVTGTAANTIPSQGGVLFRHPGMTGGMQDMVGGLRG